MPDKEEPMTNNNNKEPQPIKLFPYQEPHVRRIIQDILPYRAAYLDTSDMGDGKTLTTLAVAALCKLPVFLVCMSSFMDNWRNKIALHGIQLVGMISYDTLRGKVNSGCNHNYLRRTQNDDFVATSQWQQIVRNGVLLIFDEIQYVKNQKAARVAAARALVREVVTINCNSRIALLSASPCSDSNNVPSVLQMLGIITRPDLYEHNPTVRGIHLTGLQQAINLAYSLNSQVTSTIMNTYPIIRKQDIGAIAAFLYKSVFNGFYGSSMIREGPRIGKDICNSCYHINCQLLDEGYAALVTASAYNVKTGQIIQRNRNMSGINMALRIMGKAKLPKMVQLAINILNNNPQAKVILAAWYVHHIKALATILQNYNPLLIYGKIPVDQRIINKNIFQEPNNNCRLLIVNPTVAGASINLDDAHPTVAGVSINLDDAYPTVGGVSINLDDASPDPDDLWPRHMFVMPDHRFIDILQLTGRVERVTTRSKPVIRFIYALNYEMEVKILDSLARKSKVAKEMLYTQRSQMLYPDEYPTQYENADNPVPQNIEDEIKYIMQDLIDEEADIPPLIRPNRITIVPQPRLIEQ